MIKFNIIKVKPFKEAINKRNKATYLHLQNNNQKKVKKIYRYVECDGMTPFFNTNLSKMSNKPKARRTFDPRKPITEIMVQSKPTY